MDCGISRIGVGVFVAVLVTAREPSGAVMVTDSSTPATLNTNSSSWVDDSEILIVRDDASNPGAVTVTGSIEIAFADYAIEQPTSFIVLSIEDHGTIELQLHFRHA